MGVADTTWQKQLQSLSGQLLFRVNSILGQPLVTFIDFHVHADAVSEARRMRAARRPRGQQGVAKTVSVELLTAAAEFRTKSCGELFRSYDKLLEQIGQIRLSDLKS